MTYAGHEENMSNEEHSDGLVREILDRARSLGDDDLDAIADAPPPRIDEGTWRAALDELRAVRDIVCDHREVLERLALASAAREAVSVRPLVRDGVDARRPLRARRPPALARAPRWADEPARHVAASGVTEDLSFPLPQGTVSMTVSAAPDANGQGVLTIRWTATFAPRRGWRITLFEVAAHGPETSTMDEGVLFEVERDRDDGESLVLTPWDLEDRDPLTTRIRYAIEPL